MFFGVIQKISEKLSIALSDPDQIYFDSYINEPKISAATKQSPFVITDTLKVAALDQNINN